MIPGGKWFEGNYKPGDVLHFPAGKYTYFSGANTNGTADNPITCLFDEGVEFSNGFNLTDCSFWKFDGGVNKNLVIKNAPGVALSFKGKCNGIQISGVAVDGAYSFLWFKTEVADFTDWDHWQKNDDGTISPSFQMNGLTLTNFKFSNGKFDGCYIGSTGQNADRAVVIDGITYHPLPAKVLNIKISNGVIDGAARTGMQVSGLVSGDNFLKHVEIKNCGQSLEQYQGACFLIGGNSPGGMVIDNCLFDGSNLYAVRTDGGGVIQFTNNVVNNATVVNGKENDQPMAAVQFDGSDEEPTTLKIENNDVCASNNNVSIVVYGSSKSITADSTFLNNSLDGSFQNFSGVVFKTQGEDVPPPPPPPKATILYFTLNYDTKQAIFHKSNATTDVYDNVQRVVALMTGAWRIFFYDGKHKIVK